MNKEEKIVLQEVKDQLKFCKAINHHMNEKAIKDLIRLTIHFKWPDDVLKRWPNQFNKMANDIYLNI
jgi:hypothetical protein